MITWEYAEIQYNQTVMGERADVFLYVDGELKQLKGFKSTQKVLEALQLLGRSGWELVGATTGIGSLGPQTVRLFLKRPVTP